MNQCSLYPTVCWQWMVCNKVIITYTISFYGPDQYFTLSLSFVILTRPAINIAVNKIDLQRIRYHLSHYRVRIVWSLWRHPGDDMWKSSFVSSFTDTLDHVRNKTMYVVEWRTVYALNWDIFWCLFPRCCATREINTKITLPWAHKQFSLEYIHYSIFIHILLMASRKIFNHIHWNQLKNLRK